MIPLAVPNLCGNERKYLNDCIDTNFVSSVGPYVDLFESRVAEVSGADFAVATASGTTALHLALKVLGVQSGDLVITPSYTFVATVNSIIHSGAAPWLFDVDPTSWNLDARLVEKTLRDDSRREGSKLIHSKTGQRIAAMMPVYFNGCPADMDHFQKLSKEFNLPIVADGAAAIGAMYKGKHLAGVAQLTTFSFNGNKVITCGGGGAIVTNDQKLAQRAKHLCSTARVGIHYDHDEVGFNYRMTNIEAAVGCGQIENLSLFLDKKKKIQNFYNDHLISPNSGIKGIPESPGLSGTSWLSSVVLDPTQLKRPVDLVSPMAAKGISVRPFWRPVHMQIPYRNFMRSEMKVCEAVWESVLCLPCSTQINENEQSAVVKALLQEVQEG